MTTTDLGELPPTPTRVLRRSRTHRVGAGVAGGLGDYFAVDAVLFRVLFATAAFFGGAGILAYLLAWAAIPEEGTAHAPVDRWIAGVRRRRISTLAVAIVAAVVLWCVAFSWWAPGPFVPVVVVVVLLIVLLARRDLQSQPDSAPRDQAQPTPVNLTKDADPAPSDVTVPLNPSWPNDARAWVRESRAAAAERRRRAMPVRVTVVATLALALIVLGVLDATVGIWLQLYFWAILAIAGVGLLLGLALRRTPWSVTPLVIFAAIGAFAFAGSHASLHDGIGQREWQPVTAPAHNYRLAFGNGVLDLRHLSTQTQPRTVYVTMGAGQVRVLTTRTQNVRVVANVHAGNVQVDQQFQRHDGGVGVSRTIAPPDTATGERITVKVHVADGTVSVERS